MTTDLARWQFATTSIYHFLFVPVTIGLAFLVALLQTSWYRNDNPTFKRLTKFFGTLLLINVAVGVVTAMEHEDALNEDFNLSTSEGTTVRQLAEAIWRKVKGEGVPLRLVHDDPFEYDVQRRVPDTDKAKKMLGFEATTTLDEMLDEVIPWIDEAIKNGTI